jgi:2-deoxy-D-gluconate 3-dehydrogenase
LILDSFSLKGKTALVTGSSRGLGAGIALALAQAGAQVALHGSKSVPEATQQQIAQTGARSIVLTGDLSDEAVCATLIEQVVAEFGTIDILVNNAGTIMRAPAAEHPMEYWHKVLATNLTSVFQLMQHAGKYMLAQGSGKIINIASLLTKAFANEWAPKGVNVNAIAPGYMATDNTAALRADEERSEQILQRIPAGRWGSPSDMGGAAVFLASRASDYIHGHILVVDGGWMAR